MRVQSQTREGKFIENIRDNFLFQHITKPTRGRLGNKSNILDLSFTNEEGMIEYVTYESPLGKSDHAVLLINHRCYTETTTYTKLNFTTIKVIIVACPLSWSNVTGRRY